jgi:hypothetical protein
LHDVPGLFGSLVKETLLVVPVGAGVGWACALFLWAIQRVTTLRFERPWLLYGLPVAGVLVGLL